MSLYKPVLNMPHSEENGKEMQSHQNNSHNKASKSEIMQLDDILINADLESTLKEGASEIVSRIRPGWGSRTHFKHNIFSDGITNKLVGVYIEGMLITKIMVMNVIYLLTYSDVL